VKAPDVVTLPILSVLNSVNHRFPSGPAEMLRGPLTAVGTVYSVITPAGVILPTLSVLNSVNHTFPSGPRSMPFGWLVAVGTLNSVTVPVAACTDIAETPARARETPSPIVTLARGKRDAVNLFDI